MSMKNWFKKNIANIILILILVIFWFFYWRTIMFLPLFWDATIHWYHANIILDKWWNFLEADYPWLYYYIVNVLWVIIWEKAYNLIVFIWVFLILIYSYLLSYKITNNKLIAIFILLIIWFSSKLIFYSARLYQEILITALFLISFYYLFLILNENKKGYLYLLAFFIWVTLSIKQQGLLILYVSTCLFFLIWFVFKKNNFKEVIIVFLIPLIIWIGFYWVLFHNKWRIIIWNEDYKVLNIINYFWQKFFDYNWNDYKLNNFEYAYNYDKLVKNKDIKKIATSELEEKLLNIQNEYYNTWTQNAQNRQTRFSDIFKDLDKFNNAHNFFISFFWYSWYKNIEFLVFILLIWSLTYIIFNKNIIKKYKYILLFLIIFLWINYFLFQRNTDQARYHLFIPFYLLFLLSLFLNLIYKKNIYLFINSTVIFILLMLISVPFYEQNRWTIRSQIYSPSVGWIPSIIETWNWMKNNITDEIFFQMCWNETSYYSEKKWVWDWRIYFLDEENIVNYFKNNNIKYFVLFNSQLTQDDNWKNLCKIPIGFIDKLNNIWDRIYTSSYDDIYVYKINYKNGNTSN